MKTGVLIGILSTPFLLQGQFNLQQHLDLGRGIQTSTAEFFYTGQRAATYGFVDINYDHRHFTKKGATDIWYEVAHYQFTPLLDRKLNLTLQYNDGIYFQPRDTLSLRSHVQRAWLGGISYLLAFGKHRFPVDILIRRQEGDDRWTWQVTLVWFVPFGKRWVASGYVDIWNQAGSSVIALNSEPQVYANFGQFSAGCEVEIDRGFAGAWTREESYFTAAGEPRDSRFWLIPTLFIRYTF